MASRLSTEEVVSIFCGDTEADNKESDCEYFICEEVISASASKRPRNWTQQSRSSESNDSDSSLEQLLCEKTSHTTSSFWKKGSL